MNVSFMHSGGPEVASYRYRAAMPAQSLGLLVNDADADVLVFAKPVKSDLALARRAKAERRPIVVDFCDDHFDTPLYQEMLELADWIVCPTVEMRRRIHEFDASRGTPSTIIADPYEFEEREPHCNGNRCLWFGHPSNFPSLQEILPRIFAPLFVVSNLPLAMPWSLKAMHNAFDANDIVLLPSTARTKSPNRAVEAIRQGLFVVAEEHPSITDFPGIWIGDIAEGIAWASQNLSEANERTRLAQRYISQRYSPKTQADAWKSLLPRVKSVSTSEVAAFVGSAGSTSMAMGART